MANQLALNAINHNISNVNTPGFSRQRVELTNGDPYTPATYSNYSDQGQIGQGVRIVGVTRTHDNFLDTQIRIQNSLLGYHQAIRDNLQQAEGVLAVPGGNGIDAVMGDFFAAAQSLSIHPDDIAARSSFIQSAQNMLDAFQQQAQQLQDLRTNIIGDPNVPGSFNVSQVALTVDEINTLLNSIAELNQQILTVEAGGATPNDLLDRRDQLLEELSQKMNVTINYKNYDQVDILLGNNLLVRGVDVINTLVTTPNPGPIPDPDDDPTLIQLSSSGATVNSDITGGRLGGLLKIGGNDPALTTIRGLLEGLDTLFTELATQINTLQASGRDLNGNIPAPPDDEIFVLAGGVGLDIFNYSVNTNMITDPSLIAAAIDNAGSFDGVGDGRNALAIAQLQTQVQAALGNTTFHEYFNSQVARLGVNSRAAQDSADNIYNSVQQLEQRRQSIQGVNMEEEMINLLRFQRGFEASAKAMTTLDHVMDTIINRII